MKPKVEHKLGHEIIDQLEAYKVNSKKERKRIEREHQKIKLRKASRKRERQNRKRGRRR